MDRENCIDKLMLLLDSDDIVTKKMSIGGKKSYIIYVDNMIDKTLLSESIINPLTKINDMVIPYQDKIENIIYYPEKIKRENDIKKVALSVCEGDVALFIEGEKEFFIFSIRKYDKRSISEPPTQSVIKGPREGFIEDIKSNIILLRKRFHTHRFKIKMLKVGRISKTNIAVSYIKGVADESIVNSIIDKINKIDIDGIIDSYYIENFLSEHKYTIFSCCGRAEKPDIVSGKMLEGRVAIIVDGSPIVLTLPFIMLENLQDSYDYYTQNMRSSMLRIIRLIGGIVGVLLPALFVAMQSFHYHLLPLKFMITLANAINGIPFTPPIEMMIVLIIFEVLHQASVRMPRYIGTALSVVGAIVLGDTAVKAGLISSPAVLILALSAIGMHCIPDSIDTLSLLRFVSLVISSVLGLFGLITFSILLINYLSSLTIYKSPYLSPYAPLIFTDLKDGLIKGKLSSMKYRPYSISTNNRVRQRGKV